MSIRTILIAYIVSGEPPKKPVFSKTTGTLAFPPIFLDSANSIGNVFEKHLLDAYLAEHQTDPITNEPATSEDYIELKGTSPHLVIHCVNISP